MDILGPRSITSIGVHRYALGIVNYFTGKTEVFFLTKRNESSGILKQYQARAERVTGCKLLNIRLDGAAENNYAMIKELRMSDGVELHYSPRYASESNGVAERYMQELGMRTRGLMFSSTLPNELWAEAMNHENWLRNRLPCERADFDLPILCWKPNTSINLSNIPTFGNPGFEFMYTSPTTRDKKFKARSAHGNFVGMQRDERLCRIFEMATKTIIITRLADFKPCKDDALPGIASLLDGLARQGAYEQDGNGGIEEGLVQALQSVTLKHHDPKYMSVNTNIDN